MELVIVRWALLAIVGLALLSYSLEAIVFWEKMIPKATDKKLRKLRLVMAIIACCLIVMMLILKKASKVNNDETLLTLFFCGAYFIETVRSYYEK